MNACIVDVTFFVLTQPKSVDIKRPSLSPYAAAYVNYGFNTALDLDALF